jgi:hypothetical protein
LDAERRRGADFNNAALTSLLCPLGFRLKGGSMGRVKQENKREIIVEYNIVLRYY